MTRKRRFWTAKDGTQMTTIRLDVILTEEEWDSLQWFAKQQNDWTVHDAARAALNEGLANIQERESDDHDETEED